MRRASLLAAILASLLTGCGGSGGRSITLYNGQHPQLTQVLVAAFQAPDRHPGAGPNR